MLVKDWMTRELVTICPETTIREALSLLAYHRIRRLPVLQEGKLLGIVTARDLQAQHQGSRISRVMTHDLITVAPEVPLEDAAALMCLHKIGGIPVVDEGGLTGIITEVDVFRGLVQVMGYARAGLRLEIDCPPGLRLSRVIELLEHESVGLLSFVTGPEMGKDHHRRCILRFESLDPSAPERIEGLLRRHSIKIAHRSEIPASMPGKQVVYGHPAAP